MNRGFRPSDLAGRWGLRLSAVCPGRRSSDRLFSRIDAGASHARVAAAQPRSHHRVRTGRLHRSHLCRTRDAGAGADRWPGAGRPADDHDGCGELSGFRGAHHGSATDGADAPAGGECRRPARLRRRDRGRSGQPALPSHLRQRRDLDHRCADHRHRRPGQMAGPAERGNLQGLRRVRLRDLRRLLLPRQARSGRRRRQFGRRGSALSLSYRREGDGHPPPRRIPRRDVSCRTACSRRTMSRSSGTRRSTRSSARPRSRRFRPRSTASG